MWSNQSRESTQDTETGYVFKIIYTGLTLQIWVIFSTLLHISRNCLHISRKSKAVNMHFTTLTAIVGRLVWLFVQSLREGRTCQLNIPIDYYL